MKIIKLQLDYLQGPIWMSNVDTGKPLTGIDIIDNDEEIRKINKKKQICLMIIMNLILMDSLVNSMRKKKGKKNALCYLFFNN